MNVDKLLAMGPEAAFNALVESPPSGVSAEVAEWIGSVALLGVSVRIPMIVQAVVRELNENPPTATLSVAELQKLTRAVRAQMEREFAKGLEQAREVAEEIRDSDPSEAWKYGRG